MLFIDEREETWTAIFLSTSSSSRNSLISWSVIKMFSRSEANVELNISNSAEFTQWNSSQPRYPQHYASQYPYGILNESFVQHLLNFTIVKGETMRAILANSSTNHKINFADNDTLNYEICSVAHDNESAWFSTEFQATLHFMYITILLIAIFGNGIVCFIVCTSSRMQTVTNYFIANLALSDMLMAFFCIPFSFISLFVLQWVLTSNLSQH